MMKVSNKGFEQRGNAQAVANEGQIIIGADLTPQANDKRQVVPMVEQSQENLEAAGVQEKIGAVDADIGYFSEKNVSYLEGEAIDPYITTERLKHNEKIPLAPKGRIPEDLTAKQRMSRKLRAKKGRESYAKRKGIPDVRRDSARSNTFADFGPDVHRDCADWRRCVVNGV